MEEIIKNEDGTITIKSLGTERVLTEEQVEAEIGSINDELNMMKDRTEYLENRKNSKPLFLLVPGAGIEPALCFQNRILNPTREPVVAGLQGMMHRICTSILPQTLLAYFARWSGARWAYRRTMS